MVSELGTVAAAADASRPQADKRRALLWGAAAAAISAALFFHGTGLHPVWWLTWLAPLPILLVSSRMPKAWLCFGVAVLAWFLGSLNMWPYLLPFFEYRIGPLLIVSILPGCVFALAELAFRRFILRGALWRASLAFPLIWVTYEYVNTVTSPHSTYGSMAYTQMDCLPVLQAASLAGIWAISFCLFLLPATAAALLSSQGNRSERVKLGAAVLVFFAAVFGYGIGRLAATPRPEHSVKVVLMATGTDSLYPRNDEAALQLLRQYVEKIDALVMPGTELVVLPEKIAVVSDQATPQVDAVFGATAARVHATIIVGIDHGGAARRFNEARMYSPDGALAAVYNKHHLLPRFEDVDQPGSTLAVLQQPSGTWGIEICKDMDFPQLSRRNGAEGVALLAVPAWDFTLDEWLHGRMAVMRGVESGFTIARSAKQGILSVSDDRGRILAEQDAASVRFASLVATAPVHHDNTLYRRWGDWFAWLNIVALPAILLSRAMRPNALRNQI